MQSREVVKMPGGGNDTALASSDEGSGGVSVMLSVNVGP